MAFDPAIAAKADTILARILDPETDGQRYPLYAELRELAPVYRSSLPLLDGCYIISGFDNCQTAMLAKEAVQNSVSLESMNIRYEGVHDDMVRRWMNFRDELADHDRLRKLFFPYFTPKALAEVRSEVGLLISSLLDSLDTGEPVDVFSKFCFPLPSMVIARMLGIPMDDMDHFHAVMDEMVGAMARVQDLDAAALASRDEKASTFLNFFRGYLERRRAEPANDLISKSGLAAPAAGVSDEDLLAQYVFVLIAGHSTTADSIGNALIALDRNPEQKQLLLEGKVPMKQAVAELMRWDSSIGTVNRYFIEDKTLSGVTIPAGSRSMMLFQSAHRDPAKFENPDELDLTRNNAGDSFPFGGGRYFCLGQALAKIEVEDALTAFLARYPNYRVADLEWQGMLVSHGPKRLMVELGA
ncbi:hypothetical protein LK12_22370 [Novosphingobium malaysiense]|uniref:Cytochrome P450 n=1 Tax=Novosphingobium malaysiense TaxID=1348853 RepID=A0A0B1ZIK0_9SPHN|nr:hypothetical protein LK12_22370 [Novosphingobium malaysiense]